MKRLVIKILGLADGRPLKWPSTHPYLMEYDPEGGEGRGTFKWTANIHEALQFNDAGEIHALWTAVPKNNPVRPDGKPNRPLTAFTIEIEAIESKDLTTGTGKSKG